MNFLAIICVKPRDMPHDSYIQYFDELNNHFFDLQNHGKARPILLFVQRAIGGK